MDAGMNAGCRWLLLAAALGLLVGQTAGTGGDKMQDVHVSLDQAKTAAGAQNTFGLKLISRVASERHHANVFLSPISVFLALTMTENGAAGKTRAAMRRTLDIPSGLSEDALQTAASELLKSLRTRQGVELSIASGLWSDPSIPLAAAFIEHSRKFYDAEAATLDFSKPEAADRINAWVKDKTQGKITNIVTPQVVALSKAILGNAAYFKGRWHNPFPKVETHDEPFHLADGGQKQVAMMRQSGLRFAYRSGDGFEAAALSYRAGNVAFYAILPAAGVSPEAALAKVSVSKLINGSEPYELDLSMPRFTLDFGTSLKAPLEEMGMEIAFKYPGAEFAPLGSPLFYIGDVLHKTHLEVDEEGTVAAAATVIPIGVGAAMPQKQEKKTLVFDRPFAVLLCDGTTGAILFGGVVYNP